MKCLVIGGSGFLGSHLVKKLHEKRHTGVVLDIQPSLTIIENFQYVIGPIETAHLQFDTDIPFDVVFHLASSSVPGNAHLDIVGDLIANVVSSVKFAFECATKGNAKLVFLSSGGTVYGDLGTRRLVETDPLRPRSAYGAAKLSIETYLQVLGINHALDYRIVRLSNPYGPGQSPWGIQGLVPVLMRKISLFEEIEIWGNGSAVRDYVYIDDVIQGLIDIATSVQKQQIYNLGSGSGQSVNEMISLIENVTGLKARINYRAARSFDIGYNVLDPTLLKKNTGWTASTKMEVGLLQTWEAIRPLLALSENI